MARVLGIIVAALSFSAVAFNLIMYNVGSFFPPWYVPTFQLLFWGGLGVCGAVLAAGAKGQPPLTVPHCTPGTDEPLAQQSQSDSPIPKTVTEPSAPTSNQPPQRGGRLWNLSPEERGWVFVISLLIVVLSSATVMVMKRPTRKTLGEDPKARQSSHSQQRQADPGITRPAPSGAIVPDGAASLSPVLGGQALDVSKSYKWKSKWELPFAGHGFTVRDKAKGQEVTAGEGGSIPVIGDDLVLDLPGTKEVHVEVDPDIGKTRFAGLAFSEPCVVDILKDHTLSARKAGVVATDQEGRTWVSASVTIDGISVFAFFLP